jgi:hypothetical protein
MSRSGRDTFSRLTTPLWPAILTGMLVGGLVGALSYPVDNVHEAAALIRVYQPVDPDQILTTSATASDTQQSYISGEIAYLSSPGFRAAVAKQLNETTPPEVTATQDGQSSIISVSATQSDGPTAQRVVDAALNVYGDHAREQSRQRSREAINAITNVINQLEAPPPADSNSEQTDAPQDAQARIAQLDLQRLAIEVQARRGAPAQVVQPPTVSSETGAPRWSLGAIAGALLGGLLTIGAIVGWRRRAGVIVSPADLETEVQQLLRPVVSLSGLTSSNTSYLRVARNVYAQLPSARSGRILIVGASTDSGTDTVAGLVAAAVGEHAPTDVVRLSDEPHCARSARSRTDLDDAATVVIDGGAVATTPALPDTVKEVNQIIVVVRLGRDVHDSVRVIAQLGRRYNIPISAICTRRGLRLAKPRAARHTVPKSPQGAVPTRA